MILYYLDSSAWVKQYCRESGSQWVQQLFQEGNNVACATLGVIEVLAALARKGKAGMIGDRIVKEAYAAIEGDWSSQEERHCPVGGGQNRSNKVVIICSLVRVTPIVF